MSDCVGFMYRGIHITGGNRDPAPLGFFGTRGLKQRFGPATINVYDWYTNALEPYAALLLIAANHPPTEN